jgi:glycosyltransferase involved in cell wall biosynthesis
MTLRFSIITPVYDPPLWALEECIKSVKNQTITTWEWCIADDCSTNDKVKKRLRKLAKSDPRVKLVEREENGGIVEASNSALAMATGEFVVLLDHDDSLTHDALSVMSMNIDTNPTVDYLYSDEDKIDRDGKLFDTFRKPDFAPERLRGQNYLCHLSVIRRSLVEDVGAFRQGYDGSQRTSTENCACVRSAVPLADGRGFYGSERQLQAICLRKCTKSCGRSLRASKHQCRCLHPPERIHQVPPQTTG